MTSATDVLRRMLDERGVEWRQSVNMLGCVFTRWYSPLFSDEVVAMENGDGELELFSHLMTPEQAIAATLGDTDATGERQGGAGTCHVESSIIDTYEYNRWEYELSCGHTIIWEDSEPPRYCPVCGRRIEQ